MSRISYIPYRLVVELGGLFSRALNAIFLGGSTAQTTSSRAFIQSRKSKGWRAFRGFINALFFWQEDHCRAAWLYDIERAKRVLELNEEGNYK